MNLGYYSCIPPPLPPRSRSLPVAGSSITRIFPVLTLFLVISPAAVYAQAVCARTNAKQTFTADSGSDPRVGTIRTSQPIPATRVTIYAAGASGGSQMDFLGGTGAEAQATVTLPHNTRLCVAVGRTGGVSTNPTVAGGGGGGSFVWTTTSGSCDARLGDDSATPPVPYTDTLYVAAGGGGGASAYDTPPSGMNATTTILAGSGGGWDGSSGTFGFPGGRTGYATGGGPGRVNAAEAGGGAGGASWGGPTTGCCIFGQGNAGSHNGAGGRAWGGGGSSTEPYGADRFLGGAGGIFTGSVTNLNGVPGGFGGGSGSGGSNSNYASGGGGGGGYSGGGGGSTGSGGDVGTFGYPGGGGGSYITSLFDVTTDILRTGLHTGDGEVNICYDVESVQDLAIAKGHTGVFRNGQSGTFTLTVSNPSAEAASGTVTVSDTLPAGLTFTSIAGTGWTCSATPAPNCTRSDTLGAGASYPPITVTVSVTATSGTSITNSATVSTTGGDANDENNTASDTVTISTPPVESVPLGTIPTLLLMCALFIGIAIWTERRRRGTIWPG